MPEDKGFLDEDKEIAYDLRQVWVKIVGEQLNQLQEAKNTNIPSKYFSELEDLYDLVQQKFKDKKETKEKIQKIMGEAAKLANNNLGIWTGKIQSTKKSSEIHNKLRQIERMLYDAMEEGNMYGGYYDDEGL